MQGVDHGNALGAWIGGMTISAGLGFTAPIWAGAALTLLGLVVLLGAERLARRTPDRRPAAAELVDAAA